MHWQSADTEQQALADLSDSVDLLFAIRCRCLPSDHHWALKQALQQALPWLADHANVAIHSIYNASSGNGWIKPESGIIYLSRRTRLCLRLPKQIVVQAQRLEGQQLDIAGYALAVDKSHIRYLDKHKTLFARHIVDQDCLGEDAFIAAVMTLLQEEGVVPPRIISGREHYVTTPQSKLMTRSVMVDGLKADEAIHLQEAGIGNQQQLGIGIFLPHKSIDAVYSGDTK